MKRHAELKKLAGCKEECLTKTFKSGDTIKIDLDIARMHIFDKDTEKCIVH